MSRNGKKRSKKRKNSTIKSPSGTNVKRENRLNQAIRLNQLADHAHRVGIWSIWGPIVLALTLFFVDVISCLETDGGILTVDSVLPIYIGYVEPTVLSSALFLVLQQFILLVPSGISNQWGGVLAVSSVVHGFLYCSYLRGARTIYEQWFICIVCVLCLVIEMGSLDRGGTQTDADNFSGCK